MNRAFLLILGVALLLGCAMAPVKTAGPDPRPSNASTRQGSSSGVGDARVLSHDLAVTLRPGDGHLSAGDRMTLRVAAPGRDTLTFPLSPTLVVKDILAVQNGQSAPLAFTVQASEKREQHVTVTLPPVAGRDTVLTLAWTYEGVIHDPPRASGGLRFVTPSETAGHIGEEGVYLSGETRWYPDLPGSLATFRVRVTVPQGWDAVTHGREVSRLAHEELVTTEWAVTDRTDALTLVANRFRKSERTWRDPAGHVVTVAAYLFPEDAHLADEYLDASIRYLDIYTGLLGPYPFPKFAVVENFFPSGLGMPSFTLLGSGVIKRHYVQPYALGHEIVHSWFGNGVLNDLEQGNWVEGLTTYLANYYYVELTEGPERAAHERWMMLLGYTVYVWPDEDYPVGHFRRKTDQKDNAIGYQKAAMVFHMLRRELGEEGFWKGIRTLVADYLGAYASWREVEQVFARTAGRDLRWFFAQWVEGTGAPALTVQDVRLNQSSTEGPPGTARDDGLLVRVGQQGGPFRLTVEVAVTLAEGGEYRTRVRLDQAEQLLTLRLPGRPVKLTLDPAFETFRRLGRAHVPPMLNLFVTDRARLVLLPDGAPADSPYGQVAARLQAEA
ncbi:MAG: M1 family metallopeptidase, partial [Nitrospirales bacterium]